MRLISKKTPILIAGAEIVRRKVLENREQETKRRRRRRLTLLSVLLLGIAAVVLATQRQKSPDQVVDITSPQGRLANEAPERQAEGG